MKLKINLAYLEEVLKGVNGLKTCALQINSTNAQCTTGSTLGAKPMEQDCFDVLRIMIARMKSLPLSEKVNMLSTTQLRLSIILTLNLVSAATSGLLGTVIHAQHVEEEHLREVRELTV